ncbi:MAG: IPT/TIG domain-containing protein [Thermomicrobiales bacterium]
MGYAYATRWALYCLLAGLLVLVVGAGPLASHPAPSPARPSLASMPARTARQALPTGLTPLFATALTADQTADYAALSQGDQPDAFHAANPAHHLAVAFQPDGVAVTGDPAGAASDTWRMRLAAVGYGDAPLPVIAAPPTLNGARIEYRRGNITEWYLNSPLGIEQGFTLASPPAAERTGDLVLALNVTDATATLDDADGILLTTPGGGQLRYGALTVADATGRALPARLDVDGSTIRIRVDDRGAVYPLIVDPLVQQQKLTGSGETGTGYFGYAVALSSDGNTALIGAYQDNTAVGAAFVFTRSGGGWTQQGSKLTGSGEVGQGDFGNAVALSGDGNTALIGAYYGNSGVGAAFAFTRTLATVAAAGSPQSVPVGTPFAPLTVTVTDSGFGTPVSNTAVTFAAPTVGASGTFPGGVTTATVTTDASGNATAPTFTANTAEGSYALFVSVPGQTSELFQLANTAGAAKHITATYGSDQSAIIGAAFPYTLGATVTDASGNPVPHVSVTFTPPPFGPSGTFTGSATVTTNDNGLAISPIVTANTVAGSYTVSATTAGVATSATFYLVNIPGPAASLALSGFPSSTVAGVPHPFTVTARDSGGNTATSYTGTVSFSTTNTTATLPADYTFIAGDQGVHTFSASLLNVGTGRGITATDTVTSSITGSQSGIAVTPALTGISPLGGPQAGGTLLTITGIGLTGATNVSLGGSACTGILVNGGGTSLTCTTTAHAPGTVDVAVTTPNGVGIQQSGYTYRPAAVAPLPPPQPGTSAVGLPQPLPVTRPGAGNSVSAPVAAPTGR